jgi:hypothetical protein
LLNGLNIASQFPPVLSAVFQQLAPHTNIQSLLDEWMKHKGIGKKDVRTERKIAASMLCGSGLLSNECRSVFLPRPRSSPTPGLTGSPMEKPYENAWA